MIQDSISNALNALAQTTGLEPLLSPALAAAAVAGAGLLIGIALWIAGSQFVKPALMLLGGLAGGFLGVLLTPLSGLENLGPVPIRLLGGIAGLLAGMLLTRLVVQAAVATLCSATLAGVFMLGSLTALQYTDLGEDETVETVVAPEALAASNTQSKPADDELPPERLNRLIGRLIAPTAGQTVEAASDIKDVADLVPTEAAERSREFLRGVGALINDWWGKLSIREQGVVASASVAGAVIGFLLGLFAQKRAMILLTAPTGTAIWLVSAASLGRTAGIMPADEFGPPELWLGAWIGLSIVGMVVQHKRDKKRKSKPSKSKGSDD